MRACRRWTSRERPPRAATRTVSWRRRVPRWACPRPSGAGSPGPCPKRARRRWPSGAGISAVWPCSCSPTGGLASGSTTSSKSTWRSRSLSPGQHSPHTHRLPRSSSCSTWRSVVWTSSPPRSPAWPSSSCSRRCPRPWPGQRPPRRSSRRGTAPAWRLCRSPLPPRGPRARARASPTATAAAGRARPRSARTPTTTTTRRRSRSPTGRWGPRPTARRPAAPPPRPWVP
mmetsp:Transcript_62095/g.176397  ORF Transcript_62095/g.176397 Transcript_62095/m.176397 type:complete len:229 (-) Transcript_62095:1600-2286(-)